MLKGDAGLPAALAALGPVLSSHVRGTELLRAAELAALQAIEARYITPDLLKKGYHRELMSRSAKLTIRLRSRAPSPRRSDQSR